jgi:cytochrome bd-type quinol oxidase subunit 2
MQGLSFSSFKGKRTLKDVVITIAQRVWYIYAISWIVFAAAVFVLNTHASGSVSIISALLFSASLGLLKYYLKTRNEFLIITYSGISLCLLWFFTAASNYPYMIAPAKGSSGITIAQGASSGSTLTPLIILLLAGILGVGSYTVFVYSLFKGTPVKEDKY